MTSKEELFRLEEAAWTPLHDLAHELTIEEAVVPGYYEEGWSAKDLLAHMACWYGVAAQCITQVHQGTFVGSDEEEDEVNRRFLETCRDLSLGDVLAMLHASRTRMLEELDRLPEELVEGPAEEWFRDAIDHPPDHLPRLRSWVEILRSGPPA
jgi:hypothetical protein